MEPFQQRKMRARFWVEAGLASLTGVLGLLTLVWHDWLEAFGIDPDNHDGSAELSIVVVLLVVCVAFAVTAGIEWRRRALSWQQ